MRAQAKQGDHQPNMQERMHELQQDETSVRGEWHGRTVDRSQFSQRSPENHHLLHCHHAIPTPPGNTAAFLLLLTKRRASPHTHPFNHASRSKNK